MNSITSIYIPRMSIIYTEESIKNIMFQLCVGSVERVDFIPINKKPGFFENVEHGVSDDYRSAFVHFYLPIHREDGVYLPDYTHKNLRLRSNYIWDLIATDQQCRLKINPTEYWILLRNKDPVPQTMMNIHQVVENSRYLENLIEKQAKKLEEQESTIKKLEAKLDGVHQSINQLVNGLFNKESQRGILETHINCLFPEATQEYTEDALPEKSKWENHPTTRQGDDCERRVEALEQTVRDMLKFDFHEPQEDYDEDYEEDAPLLHRCNINYIHNETSSVSTHSSMPDLIDDVSSVESTERIRNSHELCGNE